MTAARTTLHTGTRPAAAALPQRLLSALLAALVTASVLWSLAAQADAEHGDARLAQARAAASAQACAEAAGVSPRS